MDGGDGVGMEVTLIGDFYWAQDGFWSLLGADHHCGKGNLSIVLALRWILSKLSTQLFWKCSSAVYLSGRFNSIQEMRCKIFVSSVSFQRTA